MARFPTRSTRTLLATLASRATLLLLVALCTAGCAATRAPAALRPTSTATPSPLSRSLIYWSAETRLVALRADDGRERWHVGDWTWPLPVGQATMIFGPQAPVADHGMLFATANADHTAVPTAYSFDPADGSIRWRTPLAGCVGYPRTATAPLAVGGVLYVALSGHSTGNLTCGPSGWIFALRESDGAVLWRKPVAGVVFPSLALTDGVLVFLNSTYPTKPETLSLTGLRPDDGTQLWQVQRPGRVAPEAFSAADGVMVLSRTLRIGMTNQWTTAVEAFRIADGSRLWQATPAVHFGGSVEAVANGLAYVHSDLGYLYALRIADGSTAWRFETDVRSIGAPALVGRDLYVGCGPHLLVLDAASGTLVHTYTPFTPLDSTAGPAGTTDSIPYAWTQPLLTGGAIFVAGAAPSGAVGFHPHGPGTLFALDQASGSVLWQRTIPIDADYAAPVALDVPVGG